MLNPFAGSQHISLLPEQLLEGGELIAIVDDDEQIRGPLREFLEEHGLPVEERADAAGLRQLLAERAVALVLLDIGLPDTDGVTLIPELVSQHPDLAIVMLTGVADLQVAMDCIRKGADDYLPKPAKFREILFVVRKTLEKRRLIFENRKYQEDLEKAHFRIQLMHQLSLKMNTVYLSTVELDKILLAILVGITANEGLRFNRAFLALFDDNMDYLEGRMAIGTTCRERAAEIWQEMQRQQLKFLDIIHRMSEDCQQEDQEINQIVAKLRVPVAATDNILVHAALERRSVRIDPRHGCKPILLERRRPLRGIQDPYPPDLDRRNTSGAAPPDLPVPHDLINLLQEDTFVVVPLFSPGRPLGVIIADNFVTRQPITDAHISSLELFASQASLAIEHSHLYQEMQDKIKQLEALNEEVERSKHQLVAAERLSALGQMAAQMVHRIRNPVTSLGGVARLLAKKIDDPALHRYLEVIQRESQRLEAILEDLTEFVSHQELQREPARLSDILAQVLLLFQRDFAAQNIEVVTELDAEEPWCALDRQQIRQALIHILRNAREAMPNGGRIDIDLRYHDNTLLLVIRDTGVGLPPGHEALVTDSFFTSKTQGTGLGLTLVDRILKDHGGELLLRRLEPGTEVRLTIPVVPAEPPNEPNSP